MLTVTEFIARCELYVDCDCKLVVSLMLTEATPFCQV